MAHIHFRSRKRVHTRLSEKDRTQGHTRRNRSLPSPATAGLCVASEIAPITTFATLDSATLLYTYISRFSVPPTYQQKRNIRQSCRHNAVPNRFSSRFSASRTNGPRSLSRVKAGTHSAFGERSHTTAHTPKQEPFLPGHSTVLSCQRNRHRKNSRRKRMHAYGVCPLPSASRPRWAA